MIMSRNTSGHQTSRSLGLALGSLASPHSPLPLTTQEVFISRPPLQSGVGGGGRVM